MKQIALNEATHRLVGHIYPTGDSFVDSIREKNLGEMISLVESLIIDLEFVAYNYSDSDDETERAFSARARNYLDTLGRELTHSIG